MNKQKKMIKNAKIMSTLKNEWPPQVIFNILYLVFHYWWNYEEPKSSGVDNAASSSSTVEKQRSQSRNNRVAGPKDILAHSQIIRNLDNLRIIYTGIWITSFLYGLCKHRMLNLIKTDTRLKDRREKEKIRYTWFIISPLLTIII